MMQSTIQRRRLSGFRMAFAACVALLCVSHSANSQTAPARLERYLERMGFSGQEIANVGQGKAVTKLMPSRNERDVAVLGVGRVRTSREAALRYVGDPARFLAGRTRKFHTFSTPPAAADVGSAAFDESEYRDLRDCKPGSCDFKLPAAAMTDFVQQIDWSAADAKARADERMRGGLQRLVLDYMAHGNQATLRYDDVRGVRSGDVFLELVAQSPEIYEYAPELERYLNSYPSGRLEGARDVFYWTEDRLPRVRPTLTVNHMVLYSPRPDAGHSFVATKQIYASHYFEGAFELLGVVDADDGQPGSFLVTVRRFRFDNLPTGVANLRGRVRSELLRAMQADLERDRSVLESVRP